MKKFSVLKLLFLVAVLGGIFVARQPVIDFYREQQLLRHDLSRALKAQHMKTPPRELPSEVPSAGYRATWVDVQKKVKDAVLQLVVTTARFNWLEPYKSPEQGGGFGSGFFINDQGHFVSNFHVIDEASSIMVQMPSFGQEPFEAEVIGVNPERDIALLRLTDESRAKIEAKLGSIPYFELGDSDAVVRGEEVLALGYPLATQTIKSTQGIVSGRERIPNHPYGFIQISAAINPGNSGGPCINMRGEVIGINTAIRPDAQNIGYIVPINEVKSALNDLYDIKLLRKPFLGGIFISSSADTVESLSNPVGGGWLVARVLKNSILDRAGVQEEDMIYEINGLRVDRFGDIEVPWSEDKISMLELLNRFKVGDELHFVIYRKGARVDVRFNLELSAVPAIRQVFPKYEPIGYDAIGGFVVMDLTMNHIAMLLEIAPHLIKFRKPNRQYEPALIVTHVCANSQAHKSRVLSPGVIINEVNGVPVSNLADFRAAILKSKETGYIKMRLTTRAVDNLYVALPLDKVLREEASLASRYIFPMSSLIHALQTTAEAPRS